MRKYILSILMLILVVQKVKSEEVFIYIRNSENQLKEYCLAKQCSSINIVETDSKEFANGNTFVRFKQSVAQKEVVIFTNTEIDSNQFIELLIKVKTAKSDFAKSVKVITSSGESILVKDSAGATVISSELVNQMLSTAGVNKYNGRKPLLNNKTKINASTKTIIINPKTNDTLASSLGRVMSIPVLTPEQAYDFLGRESANVVLVSSVAEPHNLTFLKSLEIIRKIKLLGSKVTYVTPYLPYARSDKKDQAGVAVIGRLAADIIEASGADAIQFVRAHAPQSQGFFKIPSIQTMGRKTINAYLKSQNAEQIISPDAGFQKDATLYADELGLPVSVINKQRDLQTGESKLHDMSGPSVSGKTVAIIDDETASGGTLGKAAEFLKKQGVKKVIAVVTHLAGNAEQALNSPFIDSIAVTNTFEVKSTNPKLRVLNLAEEISNDLKIMTGIAPLCSKTYKD